MQIMGYRSYAELVVQPNMASSPDVVTSFLFDMSKTVKPRADEVNLEHHLILIIVR